MFGSPAAAAQPHSRATYVHPSLSLSDVHAKTLTTWLERLGLSLPFKLDGTVSFSLRAGVPISGLRDAQRYELDGRFSSPRLKIDDVELEAISLNLRYRDGVLQIPSVQFRLPQRAGELVQTNIVGGGALGLIPRGDLRLHVSLNELLLARLGQMTGVNLRVEGLAGGRAEILIPNADLAASDKWSGNADLRLQRFHFQELSAEEATAKFSLENRTLRLDQFAGNLNGVPLSAAGEVALSADAAHLQLHAIELQVFGGRIALDGVYPLGKPSSQPMKLSATELDLDLAEKQLRPSIERNMGNGFKGRLGGKASFSFEGVVPYQSLGDYSGYRGHVQLAAPKLDVGLFQADDLAFGMIFDGTNFNVDAFHWRWRPGIASYNEAGSVSITASAQLSLFGVIQAAVQSEGTPLPLLTALAGAGIDVPGLLDGTIRIHANALAVRNAATSPTTWSVETDLRGRGVRLPSAPIEVKKLQAAWRNGQLDVADFDWAALAIPIKTTGRLALPPNHSQLRVTDLRFQTPVGTAVGTGEIPLVDAAAGKIQVTLVDLDFTKAAQVAGSFGIEADGLLSGEVEGAISPVANGGRALTADASLKGVVSGRVRVELPAGRWSDPAAWDAEVDLAAAKPVRAAERMFTDLAVKATWRDAQSRIERLTAIVNGVQFAARGRVAVETKNQTVFADGVVCDLLGGVVHLDGRYPTSAAATGDIATKWTAVDLAALHAVLGKSFPRMSGKIDGSAHVAFAASPQPGEAHPASIDGLLASNELHIDKLRIKKLEGSATSAGGLTHYRLHGNALGGVMSVEGSEAQSAVSLKGKGGAMVASQGSVRLHEIDLGRAAHLTPGRNVPDDVVQGVLDASLDFQRKPGAGFTGDGTLRVQQLAIEDAPVTRELSTRISLNGDHVSIRDLTGDFLGGEFRSSLRLDIGHLNRGAGFEATARDVDLALASRLVGLQPGYVKGRGDVQVRGRIGRRLTGGGDMIMTRGSIAGIPVSSLRAPLSFEVRLDELSGRLLIPQSAAQAAQGQLRGNLSYAWGSQHILNGQVDFTNVNLRPLLRSSTTLSTYGQGRVTGRLTLTGGVVRSIGDVSGTLSARLEDAQAAGAPLLDRVLAIVGAGGAMVFQKGRVEATFGGGAAKIQRFELTSKRLRLFGDGTLRVNGRVDMTMTAYTGTTSTSGRGAEFLATQLLTAANPPIALLLRVNRLLSDRVIALTISGTTSNPSIQVRPGPTLTFEAARFLLGTQIGGTANPAGGL